jgi:hypothetical protein
MGGFWRRVSPEIRFWGYTPRCFAKSGEVAGNRGDAGLHNSRVCKVLRLKELREGVGAETGGIRAGRRVMLQGSTNLHVCQGVLDRTVRTRQEYVASLGMVRSSDLGGDGAFGARG